jgi:hypothetical protein
LFVDVLDVCFHAFDLSAHEILIFFGGLMEGTCKLSVVIQDISLDFMDVFLSSLGEFFVFGDEGEVVESLHVVVDPALKVRLVALEGLADGLTIDHEVEGGDEDDDEDCRQAVAPDVDAFVVDHEEAPDDPARSVEVDPITVSDVLVVLHESWSFLIVPNVLISLCHYGLGLLGDLTFNLFFLVTHNPIA